LAQEHGARLVYGDAQILDVVEGEVQARGQSGGRSA
jgi:hypothetical protein